MAKALVTTDWLAQRMTAPDVRIVDATWYLPSLQRDAKAEYAERHIPGAVYFDIDDVCDEKAAYPHMVPSPTKFSSRARKLGLGDGVQVVVYDNNNFCASARVWWMFRLFGHEDVSVLDGGLRRWLSEDRPVDDARVTPVERHFTARQNNILLREIDQMRANMTSRREQIVDARSQGRFRGLDPEPRQGLRGGHIPGSKNLPYPDLIAEDGRLKPEGELHRLFTAAGVDLEGPITTTCGSGVSAAVLTLALFELGRTDTAVYDGSWSEWGAQSDTPVATS